MIPESVEICKKNLIMNICIAMLLLSLAMGAQDGTVSPKDVLRDRLATLAEGGKPAYGHQDDLVYGHAWTVTDLETDPLDRSDVKAVCGAYPMVAGFELGGIEKGDSASLDGVPFQLIRRAARIQAARGGIVTLSWHPDNPLTGGSAWDVGSNRVVTSILKGGEKHELFMEWLCRAADFIESLDIPIIFRPWHENTAGWFWWGSTWCTKAQYRKLYRMTWEYFTRERGLTNILWCYSPTGDAGTKAFMATYPGDDIVDILGMDTYEFIPSGKSMEEAGQDFVAEIRKELTYVAALAAKHHKLLALTETGMEGIPDPVWWTGRLAPAIEGFPLTYVLTWRNACDRPSHFYGPWEGFEHEGDFKALKESGRLTFLEP